MEFTKEKIFVKDIAQKTDAYQLSKALILDDKAEFNAKPELEIYTDDVKCSHGSTWEVSMKMQFII